MEVLEGYEPTYAVGFVQPRICAASRFLAVLVTRRAAPWLTLLLSSCELIYQRFCEEDAAEK